MHDGVNAAIGGVRLLISVLAALALIAAVWWALSYGANKTYDRELDEKRRELGLPPDEPGGGA